MFDLTAVQSALREMNVDMWLLYDFRGSNILARRVLDFPDEVVGSRRVAYAVPAGGEPLKLVHRIEESALDHLPGDQRIVYLSWQEWEAGIAQIVFGKRRVAMEYSPRGANPYVSRVDAGTVELVEAQGAEVVSSGDLVQLFEATWDEEQWAMHQEASRHTNTAFDLAWQLIAESVRAHGGVEEAAVRDAIMDHFSEHGMTTYHPPIVARNSHSGLPHYETGEGDDTLIREGDLVLIDLWARLDRPRAVYSDLTRMAYVGGEVPARYADVFTIVARARDAAIDALQTAFAEGRPLRGCDIDDVTRGVIDEAGYGEYFTHRTGHSIGQETHGNGANIDHLETRDERRILPGTCFSIEPGIYQPEFGIRSEVDVFIDAAGEVHVTGGEVQTAIRALL